MDHPQDQPDNTFIVGPLDLKLVCTRWRRLLDEDGVSLRVAPWVLTRALDDGSLPPERIVELDLYCGYSGYQGTDFNLGMRWRDLNAVIASCAARLRPSLRLSLT
jgi:hypothetical protein